MKRAQEGLAEEQADILLVTTALQALTDRLATYGVASTAAAMSAGQPVVQTVVSITYTAMVAGGDAVPGVSIVTTLLSIGTSVYDMVSADGEISGLLGQISALMSKLDEDARALAMTMGLVQELNRMNDAYTLAAQTMPRINGYWDAEADKIGVVLGALLAGTKPEDLASIVSLSIASLVWADLAKVAMGMVTPAIQDDRQVQLTVSAPQGKAARRG
jgi:hypothetical protein